MSAESVEGLSIVHLVFVAVFLGVLYGARRVARRRQSTGTALFLAAAVLFVWPNSLLSAASIIMAMSDPKLGMYPVYLALSARMVACLAFVWLGLVKLWVGGREPLGYPIAARAIWLMVVGLMMGAMLAMMVRPPPWAALARQGDWLVLALMPYIAVPGAVLEESLFRGRLLDTLAEKLKRKDFAVVVQAIIFLAVHLERDVIRIARGDLVGGVRDMAIVLGIGLALGCLRCRTGNLWMPTGAHISYNTVVLLSL